MWGQYNRSTCSSIKTAVGTQTVPALSRTLLAILPAPPSLWTHRHLPLHTGLSAWSKHRHCFCSSDFHSASKIRATHLETFFAMNGNCVETRAPWWHQCWHWWQTLGSPSQKLAITVAVVFPTGQVEDRAEWQESKAKLSSELPLTVSQGSLSP
jgi:hypothetical protein